MSTGGVKAWVETVDIQVHSGVPIPRSGSGGSGGSGSFEIQIIAKSLQIWQFRLYHPSISTQPWRIYLLKAHKAGPTCPNDKDESLV